MTTPAPHFVLTLLMAACLLSSCSSTVAQAEAVQEAAVENAMQVQYLEVVTPDVDATCEASAKIHGVTFGDPIAGFGNARTASLEGGGMMGVRAPMAAHETPIVRPYLLVDDAEAAVAAAAAAGAEVAMPAMEIPGYGKFAIYIVGGINHGVWEN